MRALFAVLLLGGVTVAAQSRDTFDVFSFTVPKGWTVSKSAESVALKKDNGRQYCNSYLFRPRASAGNHQAEFEADWRAHAAKHGLAQPEKVNTIRQDGWEITSGGGTASFKGQKFVISVITRTGRGVTYAVVHYLNDPSFIEESIALTNSIVMTETSAPVVVPPAPAGGMRMTKFNTNFDDGWVATPLADYVQVTRAGIEVRLYYVNDGLEKRRANTVGPPEFYWSQIVEPGFRTSRPVKYEGVNYPPIYFMEGAAVDKRTGQGCYVGMKVIYEGGARVVLAVAPSQTAFRQRFAQPNDLDRMLIYNKFAVTAQDITGTWVRNAGGGVEYYNAYTGNYAGMSANSTSDEFVFREDGSYQSTHRYANTNNGATQFSGLDYKGRVTVSDWEVLATNRVGGKPKKFWARLEAIQNGYLLILTDSDYEPLQYVLFRRR
jgi:hypothetical protein